MTETDRKGRDLVLLWYILNIFNAFLLLLLFFCIRPCCHLAYSDKEQSIVITPRPSAWGVL